MDAAGDVFIADTGNNRIREVNTATGKITTVAGNGTAGYNATAARPPPPSWTTPTGVAVDAAGNLFIADSQ